MQYIPHDYQKQAIQHLLDTPGSALFMEMGLGKTSVTLTAIEWLINTLEVSKVLIVAPKRVTNHTWKNEIAKWDHLKNLKLSRVIGTEKQRIQALNTKADLYAISRDNIAWLVHYAIKTWRTFPFDTLVIDELSNFKNPSSMRTKALKKVAPRCNRVIGLTGTPAPNKLLGLWSQIYLLDQGKRLGQTYTSFKDKYFTPGARNGHVVYEYVPKKGAEEQMFQAIEDICLSMKETDYLELPPRHDVYEEVDLASYDRYLDFKKNEVLTLSTGEELTPVNAASMYGKLLQYCNGAVYKPDGAYEVVDNSKLDALCEDVESLDGDPVLIGYQFQSDYERILARLPKAIKLDTDQDLDDFNAGKIEVGLTQVQSLAYGINLQESCNHIFMFGMGWDLEIYLQFIKRVHRQGVKKAVINKHFVAKGSVEQIVIERLAEKGLTQDKLMEALKKYLY